MAKKQEICKKSTFLVVKSSLKRNPHIDYFFMRNNVNYDLCHEKSKDVNNGRKVRLKFAKIKKKSAFQRFQKRNLPCVR